MYFSVSRELFLLVLLVLLLLVTSVLNDNIFFLVKRPEKLRYIYRINPSYAIGSSFPHFTFESTKLVMAEPSKGCGGILTNSDDVNRNVVLIDRGECSFAEKALAAERAGAIMAIVTDSERGTSDLIDMISDNVRDKANIPAAFLSGANGRVLRSYLMYEDTHLDIQIPLNYTVREMPYSTPPWEIVLY